MVKLNADLAGYLHFPATPVRFDISFQYEVPVLTVEGEVRVVYSLDSEGGPRHVPDGRTATMSLLEESGIRLHRAGDVCDNICSLPDLNNLSAECLPVAYK